MSILVDCGESQLKGTGMGKCWAPRRIKEKKLSSRQRRLKHIRTKNRLRLGLQKFRAALHVDFCKGDEHAQNQLASLHYQMVCELQKRYKLKLRNHEFQSSESGLTVLTMWN